MSATESKVKTAPKTSKKRLSLPKLRRLKWLSMPHRSGRVCPGDGTGEVSPERQDHSLSGGESLFNGRFH